jgi:hypothetical protein
MTDDNYGTVFIGHGEIKKAVSLPEEFRDGGVELSFANMKPFGWEYNGVLHLLEGVTLEETESAGWYFTGQIVDHEGNVLREKTDWEELE